MPADVSFVKALAQLRRLNLSYCNVRNRLGVVLGGVRQRLVYVNLKDTRLSEDDLFFLAGWRTLAGLRELNLSCNDLQHLDQVRVILSVLELACKNCMWQMSKCFKFCTGIEI